MAKRVSQYVTEQNSQSKALEWLGNIRRQVAPRSHLQLDPSACSLLVIDAQRYFLHPAGRCFLPAAAVAAQRIEEILAAWRRLNAHVVFTQHGHQGEHDLGMLGRFYSDFIRRGEPDAEIVSTLSPLPTDTVFPKTTYDAFLGTDLQDQLSRRGSRQVLITGVMTHLCCETTARAAFCRGFEVYLCADATATSTETLHLGSLLSLADGVAVLMSAGEVVERCSKQKSQSLAPDQLA